MRGGVDGDDRVAAVAASGIVVVVVVLYGAGGGDRPNGPRDDGAPPIGVPVGGRRSLPIRRSCYSHAPNKRVEGVCLLVRRRLGGRQGGASK